MQDKSLSLSDIDRKKLESFIDLVQRIRSSKFMTELPKNNVFNIIYQKTDAPKIDEDLLRSFIIDIRKVYMAKESTSFIKMFPIFMKYVSGDEKKELQKCQADYEENLRISFPAGIPVKESKTVKNILDDWLYGHYIHEEDAKKETISGLGKSREFYKWMFVDNLGGLVEFAYSLEDLAKKLLFRAHGSKND
jgi:hypothetical protein